MNVEQLQQLANALKEPLSTWFPQYDTFYEENTWTPGLAGSTTAGVFTYDTTSTGGSWTRNGNRVVIEGRVRITVITTAPVGDLRITGLPHTGIASGNSLAGVGWMSQNNGITLAAGKTWLALRMLASTNYFEILENGSGVGAAKIQGGALALIGGVADFMFGGEYRV